MPPNEYLAEKGWGRPVGPGRHPSQRLRQLRDGAGDSRRARAPIADWKLDPLYRHFSHPEAGGDVAAVWGFTRDPDDRQRVEILNDLRQIVVREHGQVPSGVTPAAMRHRDPSGTAGCWAAPHGSRKGPAGRSIYEVGKLFQLDGEHAPAGRQHARGGGPRLRGRQRRIRLQEPARHRAGKSDSDQSAGSELPFEVQRCSGRPGAVSGFGRVRSAGSSKLPDGRPHPAAGTGLPVLRHVDLPARPHARASAGRQGGPGYRVRSAALGRLVLAGDGARVRPAIGRRRRGRVGLSNGVAEGPDFFCPFAADDGSYVVVVRFEFDGQNWKAVRAGQPFRQSAAPQE